MLRRNWFSSEQQTFSFFLYFKYFKNICLRTATHTGLRLFLLCHVFLPASRHTQSGSRSLWLRSTNIFHLTYSHRLTNVLLHAMSKSAFKDIYYMLMWKKKKNVGPVNIILTGELKVSSLQLFGSLMQTSSRTVSLCSDSQQMIGSDFLPFAFRSFTINQERLLFPSLTKAGFKLQLLQGPPWMPP